MKFSKFAVYGSAAITGVIMLVFQNCGQIQGIEVSDLSANLANGSSLEQGADPMVGIEIVDQVGREFEVDANGGTTEIIRSPADDVAQVIVQHGNDKYEDKDQSQDVVKDDKAQDVIKTVEVSNFPTPISISEEVEKEFLEIGENDDEVKTCVARKISKREFLKQLYSELQVLRNSSSNKSDYRAKYEKYLQAFNSTVDHFQKIKCEKRKKTHCDDCKKKYTCGELIAKFKDKQGLNVIDVAQLPSSAVKLSPRGFTILYASSAVDGKDLNIDIARGKVIVCGLKIRRLDVIKGKLHLMEGAEVKSIGEHDIEKSDVSKDQSCRIDRADEQ